MIRLRWQSEFEELFRQEPLNILAPILRPEGPTRGQLEWPTSCIHCTEILLGALSCIKNHDLLHVKMQDESLCATCAVVNSGHWMKWLVFVLLKTAGLQEAVWSQQSPLEMDPWPTGLHPGRQVIPTAKRCEIREAVRTAWHTWDRKIYLYS